MGLLKRFRRQEIRADPDETMFEDALLTALLGSGKATKQMALQVPTVSGGIDLIANVVAGTPVKLYREENGKAIEVPNDPRVRLLNDETGDTLNANEFWHAMIRDYYTGKGGYAYINRVRGEIRSLHYVDESRVAVNRNTDAIFKDFDLLVDGTVYRPFDFLKLLRNTKDGAVGVPITEENAKLIEVAYQSLCFELYLVKKGGNKKGFLQSEKRLDKASMDELKQAFANLYSNSSDNEVRESKNLTQGELGRLIHADKSKVSRIENNSRSVALSDIVDIAKALDVRLEYLLGIDSCIDETSECIETLVRSFTKITTTKAYTDNIKKSALCDVEDAVFCIDEDYLMLVGRNSIFFLIKDIATAENAKGHVSPNVYTKMIDYAKQKFCNTKEGSESKYFLISGEQMTKIIKNAVIHQKWGEELFQELGISKPLDGQSLPHPLKLNITNDNQE